jgi:hypothetical protein
MDLLERQAELQAGARRLVDEFRIEETLQQLGRVLPLGSAVTGLMVWPDIDYCVGLETDDVWNPLLPLLERCSRLFYLGEPERHYFVLRLEGWKVDLSLFKDGLPEDVAPSPAGIDHDTRLLILELKNEWRRRHPGEDLVCSFEIYEAVLKEGLRTIEEIEARAWVPTPTRSSRAASTSRRAPRG